jgi:hypothetical protein
MADAAQIQQGVVQIKARMSGSDAQGMGQELTDLAMLQFAQGRYAETEALLRQALAQQERTFGPEHLMVGKTVHKLAELAAEQDDIEQGAPLYHRTLSIYEKALGPTHPDMTRLTKEYVTMLRRAHRDADADRLEARSKGGRR